MEYGQIKALTEAYFMDNFGVRQPVVFTGGKGATLYGSDGKHYADFLAGIAVCALGYGHEGLAAAICEHAHGIIHCSNLFYSEEQAKLARLLAENTCADRVFFANSGAEANEAAVKLARKYFYKKGEKRYKIVSTLNSFHGRTLATVAATGQEKYKTPFLPMPEGFLNVPYKDISAMEQAVDAETAAVLVEPVQGEGGIIEGGEDYLAALRKLCDARGVLLIFDEIQTGMGRTGKLFAHELYGVEPDMFTSAKALAGGIPLGALLAKEHCAAFEAGDHGTTFGGGPLACAAGLVVLGEITQPGFLDGVAAKGALLRRELTDVKAAHTALVKDVRGRGLILGVELAQDAPAKDIQAKLLAAGFVVGTAGGNTLRLVPPLVIEEAQIRALCIALDTILKGWNES